MADVPMNGAPPPGAQQQQLKFSSPDAMRAWLAADMAQYVLQGIASQLMQTQLPGPAQFLLAKAQEVAKWKEDFLRQDQGGIFIAGPGDVPPRLV